MSLRDEAKPRTNSDQAFTGFDSFKRDPGPDFSEAALEAQKAAFLLPGEKVFEKRVCTSCHRKEMQERRLAKRTPKTQTAGWNTGLADSFLRPPLRVSP